MPKEQSAHSHAQWDPLFHFFLMPIFAANFIVAVERAVRAWPHDPGPHLWSIVIAAALFVLCGNVRRYGLANQDRIIRLEERLRIGALAPFANVETLTTRQLIALRFASDAELPGLVQRTLAEDLDPKTIKQSIAAWRPDHHRI